MKQLIVMLFSCCILFAGMDLMAKKAEAAVKKEVEVEKKKCGCKSSGKCKGKNRKKATCKKGGEDKGKGGCKSGCKSGKCAKKAEEKKKCCGTCKKADKEIPKGMEKGS